MVEDDSGIIGSLTTLLAAEGYSVKAVSGQHDAINALSQEAFDLVLLDITLEEGNGFAVCAAAQALDPTLPVIFLTASDDEFSTVAGLEMGAVDYIAKPFRPRELLSRIKVALRRRNREELLTVGSLQLDPGSAQATKSGVELMLSALEYRLLLYFMQHKDRVITRENLRDAIWDTAGEYVTDNSLNVYIKRLRQRIEDDPSDPKLLHTVRGLGWKLSDSLDEQAE